MDKKNEFIEKVSLLLTRYVIQDKFNKIDTSTARLHIANSIYLILDEMNRQPNPEHVKDVKNEQTEQESIPG